MRPQRTIQPANYREASDSESNDSNSSGSTSDLTDIEIDEGEQYPIVHLPTASEVVETKTLILVKEEELDTIDAEYRELKRKLDSVERKRNATRNSILGLKSRLSRIHTLPQEVLGYVFLFYMDDPAHSPWTLMQVTRTWRATALSTRAIWAKIMLTSPAWQKRGASRRKDGREVCGSTDQLDRALRRAGNEPLDIEVLLKAPPGYKGRKYSDVTIASMINHLASTQRRLQVEHLHVHGEDHYRLPRDLNSSSSMFPNLKTLRLASSCCETFVAKISPAFQRLTEVHAFVTRNWNTSTNLTFYDSVERWTQVPTLTSLSLHGHRGLEYTSFEMLHNALQNAQFLTTLELSSIVSYNTSNDPAPLVLRLPNLRALILKGGFRSWVFDTPCLTSLAMNRSGVIPSGPPDSNDFPLLSSITIVYGWLTVDHFEHIHFPPLHTLDISFAYNQSYRPSGAMKRNVDLNPIVFRLRKANIGTSTLVSWFPSMNRLEELVLEEMEVNHKLFDFLASPMKDDSDLGLSMTKGGQLPCPRLVRLQVGIKGGSPDHIRKTKTAAKKAVKARNKAGIAIEKWLVITPEDIYHRLDTLSDL